MPRAIFEKQLTPYHLQPPARQALEEDVQKLESAAREPQPDRKKIGGMIETIAGKLKMAGVIAADVVALAEPLGKTAALFHLSLAWLGLG
ncbi:MAG TPA: hypothetical protein VG675_10590 [Bryobacteraceae bacterium]|nr:hypothetical protein [Bryobacteraceae bacterium]